MGSGRIEPLGVQAVRTRDWKLVWQYEKRRWELYEMNEDRTELHDLADADPDRVARMAAMYQRWADACGAVDFDRLRERRRTGPAKRPTS